MNFSVPKISRWTLLLFAISMHALTSVASGAAGIAVSPSSVAIDYNGQISLVVAELANGNGVVVEKFADFNGDNAIDPSDLMVQSFRISDGQAANIGGVRNSNIPGDDDGVANGRIQAAINFQLQEIDRAAGHYIYRISSAAGEFAPMFTGFVVTQPSHPQKVTGRVTSGGGGVPYAMVALLNMAGKGGFVTSTSSDANGNFSLAADSGTYIVAAFKSGFLFNFQNPPVVTLDSGGSAVQNVALRTCQ